MDKYKIDSHKLYWHLDRVKQWQETRVITPLYIEVSPVSYCNHKCIFCGIDFAMEKAVKLDSRIFRQRLGEMGKLGVRSIMYAGEGEPLLHKDFPAFVEVTKKSGIDVAVTTNGTKGTYSCWKDILPYLSWIKFSVDAGTSRVYSKVHGVPESFFDKTLKSISDVIKVKRDYKLDVTIGVQFLVIEENIDDIRNAIELFSQMDIDYFLLKPYSLHPQMLKKRDSIYTKEKINFIQDLIDEFLGKIKIDIVFRRDSMEKYMSKDKCYNHCRALPFWGYITSKGDFYTCSVYIGDEKFKAGNIYEKDMKDIFLGDKRRGVIEFAEKELIIDDCRVNCRMARINEFLEFLAHEPGHINFI